MIIKNGLVFGGDGAFAQRDLYVNDNHKIAADPMPGDSEVVDASGLYVLPGLVDVHIHGAVGHDFCDGDSKGLQEIAAFLKSQGITSFCPTSMTLPAEELKQIFQSVLKLPEGPAYASVAGIHMEGPFISPAKKGAQKESYIVNPDIACFRELNDACQGMIRLVTIAPELAGSMEFIEALHEEVAISLGHSTADYETALSAFAAGASHATHLFNAMPPFAHRDPGVIGAALDTENCMAELICDGYHIHPSMIRAAFKMFGEERICLISDSMMATGMPDGTYELGGQAVYMKDRFAALSDGTLAGSATNLFDCMKKAMEFGIPESTAIFAATRNPAKSIGIYHQTGSLTPGKYADILLVDEAYNLEQVL